MLLLYGLEGDDAERAERWAEMPLWDEVNASLEEAGVLVKHGPLHGVATATTVRVRGDETELTVRSPSPRGGALRLLPA
jgi:hypothetical protein